MNDEIFLSYIVPCFNVQKYLPKCLESLGVQSIKEGAKIEFILVNDGSKDETLNILKEFANKEERAKIVDQSNKGVCAARNIGLQLAKGQYVFFLDGDDFLTKEASQLVYNESKKDLTDIIIPNAYSVREDNLTQKTKWDTFGDFPSGVYTVFQFVNKIKQLPISVKVYKRETLIANNVYFDEDLVVGEVYTFFIHALAYSEKVSLTEGRMMNWVIRSVGTTKGYNLERDQEIVTTMHRIDKYADNYKFSVKLVASYQASMLGIVNLFSVRKYFCGNCYSESVVEFLVRVVKDEVYQSSLKFFLYIKPKSFKKFCTSFALYFVPIRFLYKLALFLKKR